MTKASHQSIPALSSIGIDIGKDVFHLVGFDPSGAVVLRRKIRRLALVKEFEALPRLCGRHGSLPERTFREPQLAGLGFEPRIIPRSTPGRSTRDRRTITTTPRRSRSRSIHLRH